MRVYRISRWMFLGICLLILSLPVSHHWRLLATGKYTGGEVTRYIMRMDENAVGVKTVEYVSEIRFRAGGGRYTTHGPANCEYREGREVMVVYKEEDPSVNQVLTFSALYLDNYVILPLVLLTLWAAFYLSFNNYYKKSRSREIRPREPWRGAGR